MTDRTKNQDLWHKRGFAAGIAVACSTMVGTWGEEVAVEEILSGAGLDTRAKMKALGVDDYDLDILRPVFTTLRKRSRRVTIPENCEAPNGGGHTTADCPGTECRRTGQCQVA